jgi:tyrosine-protein kinase Etk/Wzc
MTPTIQQLPYSGEQEDTLDLGKYFHFLGANRWLIAGVTLLAVLIGAAYVLITRPVYEASILIQVEESTAQPKKDIPGDISGAFAIKTGASSEMEIIRSRGVVSQAVQKTGIDVQVTPKYLPLIGAWLARHSINLPEPAMLRQRGYVWGAEKANVAVFDVPPALQGRRFVLTAGPDGVFRLDQPELDVHLEGRAGTTIETETPYGGMAVRIDRITAKPGAQFFLVRAPHIETVERLQKALKLAEKGKQSGIISVALDGPDGVAITGILNEIGQEYIRQNVYRKSEEAEKSLAFLNKQLPELKQEVERSENRYTELRNKYGTVDLGEEAKTLLQRSAALYMKLVELKQRKEELAARFEDAHPTIVSLNRQIAELNHDLRKADTKIKELPAIEQEVLRSYRQVKVNTELYTQLLGTAQQLRLATESRIGNSRLLDKAVVPIKPIKPRMPLVLALAAAIGLTIGVALAWLRKTLYGRLEDPFEIEHQLGLPISTTIPHSGAPKQVAGPQRGDKEIRLLPHDDQSENVIESLRRLRTMLQFGMLECKNNIVMITGPTPGVGKSFVSANFATVLAAIGKRVLLIDADLRTGGLHRYFGLVRRNGLAEVLHEQIGLEQAIHRSVAPNVDFISTGGYLGAKSAEWLSHSHFGELLERCSARYDFVLIDTPPVLAVSDPLIIASHAGIIFNVVRSGLSTMHETEETVKRLNQAGYRIAGIVLNDLRPGVARYDYGSDYGQYRFLEAE